MEVDAPSTMPISTTGDFASPTPILEAPAQFGNIRLKVGISRRCTARAAFGVYQCADGIGVESDGSGVLTRGCETAVRKGNRTVNGVGYPYFQTVLTDGEGW